ncbi:hypothetical protein BKA70DRAFT_647127 [Coprinopsis sp. MPI-PUGE-AT-0042]|nr:hypothetical protein BKA70DRAFT_647127 [Coprinopsis sp. MPI-PUGE-AT-0042]
MSSSCMISFPVRCNWMMTTYRHRDHGSIQAKSRVFLFWAHSRLENPSFFHHIQSGSYTQPCISLFAATKFSPFPLAFLVVIPSHVLAYVHIQSTPSSLYSIASLLHTVLLYLSPFFLYYSCNIL